MVMGVLEIDKRTLDDVLGKEKFDILVVSDNPIYNAVASEVFSLENSRIRSIPKSQISGPLDFVPSIILVDLNYKVPDEDLSNLSNSLTHMESLGTRYKNSTLVGTLEPQDENSLYGIKKDLALHGRLTKLASLRDSPTKIQPIAYPFNGTSSDDAERIFRIGLTNLLDSYIMPEVIEKMHMPIRTEPPKLKNSQSPIVHPHFYQKIYYALFSLK